jgi:hypothetical protein
VLIKKLKLLFLLPVVLVLLGQIHAAVITGQDPVTVNLGSGANVSYLVFNESTLSDKPIRYAWHYDGLVNPVSGTSWSGEDLFQGILSASAGTDYALSVGKGAYGLYMDFTIGTNKSVTIDPLDSPVWTYWISGGSEYVEYGDNGPFNFEVPSDRWLISPSYASSRWISDGSYDGWTISPFSYAGEARDTHNYTDTNGITQSVTFGTYSGMDPQVIPEPDTCILFVFSSFVIIVFARWRSRKKA